MKQRPGLVFVFGLGIFAGCSSNNPQPLTNDGSLISFVEWQANGIPLIAVVNHDGSNKQFLFNEGSVNGFTPAYSLPQWSFDRKKIVFISNRDGEKNDYDIYAANADGSSVIKKTDNPSRSEHFPCFSPNGAAILFTAYDAQGNIQLFTIDSQGNDEKQITFFSNPQDSSDIDFPSWSHDGKKIIFSSNKDNLSIRNIYIMNADGSNIKAVTDNPSGFSSSGLSISPDDKTILYSTNVGVNHQIFSINTDGSNKRQLTNFLSITLPRVYNGQTCWSPDGKRIAFLSNKDKNYPEEGYDLYTMDTNGTHVTQISHNNTFKFYPDWR